MSTILSQRIKNFIDSSVSEHLNLDDCNGEDDSRVYSRGLTAIAISTLSGRPYKDVSAYVVDGTNDNGIDGAYYDDKKNRLLLIQSKWSTKGTSTIETGDMHKFITGIYELLNVDWPKFNSKFKAISAELEHGIKNDPQIYVVAAYNSDNPVSSECQTIVDKFLSENNTDSEEIVKFDTFNTTKIIRSIKGSKSGISTDIELNLLQWGEHKEPYYSIYGKVCCADVAEWYSQYDRTLFTENIRDAIPESEINTQIEASLIKNPTDFWYLNNGLTATANRISKKRIGMGDMKESAYWNIENIKIVNGAQTTSSIFNASRRNSKAASQAFVQIKIISLEDTPLELSSRITTATNTQNKVEPRDFLALEEAQNGLAEAFHKIGVTYCFRRSDKPAGADSGLDVEELALMLAVSSNAMSDVVMAKRNLGALTDPKAHYPKLFASTPNASDAWEKVKLLREIREALDSYTKTQSGRDQQILVHGNRFMENILIQSNDHSQNSITNFHEKLKAIINEDYPDGYLAVLFKNTKKCQNMKDKIEGELGSE